jgi:hypothetical protein
LRIAHRAAASKSASVIINVGLIELTCQVKDSVNENAPDADYLSRLQHALAGVTYERARLRAA